MTELSKETIEQILGQVQRAVTLVEPFVFFAHLERSLGDTRATFLSSAAHVFSAKEKIK